MIILILAKKREYKRASNEIDTPKPLLLYWKNCTFDLSGC
jgi:hypothetical protein